MLKRSALLGVAAALALSAAALAPSKADAHGWHHFHGWHHHHHWHWRPFFYRSWYRFARPYSGCWRWSPVALRYVNVCVYYR